MPEPLHVTAPRLPLASAYWPAVSGSGIRETTIGSVLREAAGRAPEVTALVDGDPASAAQVLYTSGTTGRPKGAVLSPLAGDRRFPHDGVREDPQGRAAS